MILGGRELVFVAQQWDAPTRIAEAKYWLKVNEHRYRSMICECRAGRLIRHSGLNNEAEWEQIRCDKCELYEELAAAGQYIQDRQEDYDTACRMIVG